MQHHYARIIVLALLTIVSITTSAYDFEVGGIYYNYIDGSSGTSVAVTSGDNIYTGDVNIPELVSYKGENYSVTTIGEWAFGFCGNLTSVYIPNSVTSIRNDAFRECSHLTNVFFPCSLTSIGEYAFRGCRSLSFIVIPNSVTSLGYSAFENCSYLTSLIVSNSINVIDYGVFRNCSSLTSITIPNNVNTIVSGALEGCSNLTSVIIPYSVTSIGYYTFAYCQNLTDVYCYATEVPKTDNCAFEEVPLENATLHVPSGCKEAYVTTYPWSEFGTIVEEEVGGNLFPDCPEGEIRDAALFLYSLGIVQGENGLLLPDREATRAEVAKTSLYGVYSGPANVPSDLPSDHHPTIYSDLQDATDYYYRPARALLYLEYGDGVTPFDRDRLQFAPEENITRLHVLKVLMEAFNIKPNVTGTNNPFPNDADVTSLASKDKFLMGYIRKAADLGIITTANDKFHPNDFCTRGHAFLMLARIMQKTCWNVPTDEDFFQPLNTTQQTIALGLGLSMGNFNHYTKTSFAISGTVPLIFSHAYNSYNTTLPEVFYGANSDGETYQPLGDGWSHNYHSYVTIVGKIADGTARAVVHWGGGSFDVYKSNGSSLVPESYGVYDEMTVVDGGAVVKTKSQMTYRFTTKSSGGPSVLYLTSVEDRNGNTLTLNYETGENSAKRIKSVSDGNRSLTFTYRSGTNLLKKVSDPLGRSIQFDYEWNDQTGRYQLASFTDAKNQTTTYEYGDNSKVSTSKLLEKIKLPKGNYIENEYDANRRLNRTVTGVNGTPTTETAVTVNANYGSSVSTSSRVDVTRNGSNTASYNYTFNANNSITKLTGEEGLSITSSYGDSNHPEMPTSIQSNSTNISNITYDSKGNVTKMVISGDGTQTTTMTYDSMNNLTSVTDPMNYTTTYTYDPKGNLIKVSAPESVTTNITVNSKGLPTEITNAMGVKTLFEYNSYGNLTKTTLPALSLSSSATYDKASRLLRNYDALNRKTEFTYDSNDNLLSTKDHDNHTTTFDYDKNDNLVEIKNAKDGVTTLTYDYATDWLTSVSFANATKKYAYNDDGTLDTYTKPDGTKLYYEYDDLGRVTNDGVNSYTYDNKLRLESISGNGRTLSFTYDGFNRITGTSYDDYSNSYSYDKNGNCLSINNTSYTYDKLNRMTAVKFNNKTINYTYRKDSQLSEVSYPNGMTTTYGYDAVGRLTSKKTKLSNGTVIASYSYTLDKVGNITKQTIQEPYDGIVLNNEDISYSYNEGNRITKAGDISFTFDKNGNTTKRGSESYSWDEKDRLVRAGSTDIEYDPLGLIASYGDIEFTTDPLGIGNVLSDSESGAQYIYGNGLEARVKNGKVSYYVTDFRGSVVAIVDESGNITHKYQYDEFGKVTQKQEADYNPFQYIGKYGVMDLNDHQYYMRARHYDPTIGRFLSEDPIWSTNLYPYANNNPVMGIDPEGKIETLSAGYEIYQGIKTVTSVGTQYGLSASTKAYIASEVAKDKLAADALISSLGSSSSTVAASSTTAASTTAVETAGMSAGGTLGAVGLGFGIVVTTGVLIQDGYKAVQNARQSENFVDFINKQDENGGWIYKGSQWVSNKIDQGLDNTLGKIIN